MYIVQLKFAENRALAPQFMAAHNQWLRKGFDDGVFLLSGTLQPKRGGAIFANGPDRGEIEKRVADDPFVAEGIVTAEIIEVTPGHADARLQFLIP